jgi:hypothetical protein
MDRNDPRLKTWVAREASILLFYLAVAQVVSASFLSQWGADIAARLPLWLDGTMPRPFAFRVATPWLLERVLDVLPRDRLEAWMTKPICAPGVDCGEVVADQALARYASPPELMVEMLAIDVGLIVSILLTAYCWRGLLGHFRLPSAVRLVGPGLFLLAVPMHFAAGGYIYDFPELLLASLATWMFVARRWTLFYPVLAAAVLNKEAAVLMCAFCMVFVVRRDVRGVLVHGSLAAVFGLLPFIATRILLADRPGADMVDHLAHNFEYLLSSAPWLGRGRVYHPIVPAPAALNIVLIALTVFFVGHQFPRRPLELRILLLTGLACLLPLYLLFGNENEVRVFALCFPSAMALAAHTLADLLADARLREISSEELGLSDVS